MPDHKLKNVVIYTDGACSGNPGNGGWGAILSWNGHEHEIYGGMRNTTNNKMELTAAIEALSALKTKCKVDIYTDSVYLRSGITEWIFGWQKNDWKTSSKKPVKNVELWKKLVELNNKHQVVWHWVKGHNGDENNERADALARKGISEIS